MIEQAAPRTYLPIDGLAAYDKAVQELVFGADSVVIQERRALTVQAVGGTGALKIGADFLKRFAPDAQVYISDPSWENHRALFESAGFVVNNYAYYDAATRGVDFNGMLAAGDEVVGHVVVEQVGHAVDEDPARLLPAERQVQLVGPEHDVEALALDVLRALGSDPESAAAVEDELATTRGGSTLLDAHVERTLSLLASMAGRDTDDAQRDARRLTENLALALQSSLMLRHAPSLDADTFISSRLGADRGWQYGVLSRGTDAAAIVARH